MFIKIKRKNIMIIPRISVKKFLTLLTLLFLLTGVTFAQMDRSQHQMKMNHSENDTSIVRKGAIDLRSIDENKDGKVYQDMMDWNVISDEPGECPLCGMTLKEVTLFEAEKNLTENGFNVIGYTYTGKMKTAENKNNGKSVWNKYCPITGKHISRRAETLEYDGKTMGFCCAGSKHHEVFLQDPEKYLSNLSEDGQEFIGKRK